MNKKAFTYMLVASFIVAVIILVFLISTNFHYQEQGELYSIRIRLMNDFVRNFNSDVHRASYIASFRSLVALEDSVTSQGIFLKDMNESFRETFFYGTINGTYVEIMENTSFQNYLSKVESLANTIGINLNVNVSKVSLTQSDPWSIDVHVFADINMTDSKRLASWVYSKEFITNVPIYDLRDPLYGKFTLNKVPNTVRMFNETDLVHGLDITYLINHTSGSYYRASDKAPNFLMRFEGSNNPDPNGIESIVDIAALSDQDLPVYQNKTKIDFMYFNNITSPAVICNLQNVTPAMPGIYHFIIPKDRMATYNLTDSGIVYWTSTNCTG